MKFTGAACFLWCLAPSTLRLGVDLSNWLFAEQVLIHHSWLVEWVTDIKARQQIEMPGFKSSLNEPGLGVRRSISGSGVRQCL